MSNDEFGWESLLATAAPSGCMLKAALFTTYDRADGRFLAEHLLPLLLKLSREPDGDGAERQYFLLELDRRLKQLHDRLVVISSTTREEPEEAEDHESTAYAWIWRSMRHLTVGSLGKAVQHAKLWLLHWGASDDDDVEYLEIVVSSTNLTRAAFRGQLQGAWRACLELRPQPSQQRLARWGVLPHFLRELALSAGEEQRLAGFTDILSRAECPDGVEFVASVPGTHTKQVLQRTPWGAAGLRKIVPMGKGAVRASILSPYIGAWNAGTLAGWCRRFGGTPDRLELVWIDKNDPWAGTGRWILPQATLKALAKTGATLLQLRYDPRKRERTDLFHAEQRPSDNRWSHAKLYSFRRGTSRRLLVTSANFSTAAWGAEGSDGSLAIENFELGVSVAQAPWPFGGLDAFEDTRCAATVSTPPRRGPALITWAQASWNGKDVHIACRCEAARNLQGVIFGNGRSVPAAPWKGTNPRSSKTPWKVSGKPPSLVRLTCEEETVNVPVFDERPPRDREYTLPPEVDEDAAQAMLDELLFEQYGGRVAADDTSDDETQNTSEVPPPAPNGEEEDDTEDEDTEKVRSVHSDSYGVPAFDLARRHLGVVDTWSNQVNRAWEQSDDFALQVVRRDGELLAEAFERQAERDGKKSPDCSIGARLAAEELALRLKHFPEE